MRLEIGVIHKLARADSCAVDHEVELCIDIFEFFEADVRVDFPGSLAKARCQVIEINRSVHQRDAQRETTGKAGFIVSGSRARGRSRRIAWRNVKPCASGFDSLTSHSLSLRPSRPCRGSPSRSILDFARDGRSAQRNGPIWNFDFARAQKLPRFDD